MSNFDLPSILAGLLACAVAIFVSTTLIFVTFRLNNMIRRGDERNLTNAFVIAPGFRLRMWGNFGLVNGHIIVSQFQMGGSAEGTIKGSLIQMNDLPTTIDGSADVVIASTGTTQYPAGVTFGVNYTGIPGSYMEVKPD